MCGEGVSNTCWSNRWITAISTAMLVLQPCLLYSNSPTNALKYADLSSWFPSQGMLAYTWVRRSDIQKKLAELLLA